MKTPDIGQPLVECPVRGLLRKLVGQVSTNLCVDPFHSIHCVLYPAVEVNRTHVLRASLLPGISIPQPVICFFHLWGDRSVGGVTCAEVNRLF